jgi:hypothetical protein
METLQQVYKPFTLQAPKRQFFLQPFIQWCAGQEANRFGWLAVILAVHGCFLTPATVLTIAVSGNNIVLWGFAIGAMAISLVSNLAALPTKITIPVFFLSVLIDLAIVVSCVASFSMR